MDRQSQVFLDACSRFQVDPKVIAAMIQTESEWRRLAFRHEENFSYVFKVQEFARALKCSEDLELVLQRSSFGYMQIMGGTARWLGFTRSLEKLFEPAVNLEYGIKYYLHHAKRYSDVKDIVAAYNSGAAKKDKDGVYVNEMARNHVRKFVENLKKEQSVGSLELDRAG